MKNKMTYLAIHIDDMERAKKSYEEVFERGFSSFGPPDFLQIKAGKSESSELSATLQSGKYAPVPEKKIGLECAIGIENIRETIEKVKANSGQVLMPKTAIPYVSYMVKFLDTESNLICGMQYDNSVR